MLRVLQDLSVERVGGHGARQVDVRVIAATNRSLCGLVENGRFRADLYYRLAGVEVHVPPLRARRGDIPLLVEHFVSRYRRMQPVTLSVRALDALVAHDWPGNVRQLVRVLERAMALAAGPTIEIEDLPPEISKDYQDLVGATSGRDETLRAWCSRYVRLILERCNGNKRRACEVLDISYHTLQAHLAYETGRSPGFELRPPVVVAADVAAPPRAV